MVEYSLVKNKHSLLCSSYVLLRLPCCLLFCGVGGGGGGEEPLDYGGGKVSVNFCVGTPIFISTFQFL